MWNNQQQDHIMIWIGQNMCEENSFTNTFKKNSLRLYNSILLEMAKVLCKNDYVQEKIVQDRIMNKFFCSRETARRYTDRIKTSKIFKYDETIKSYLLPDELKPKLEILR